MLALAAVVVIALLATFGFVRLFLLRFESGDIYPAYSSLRADPLGTRALYEAVRSCPGADVSRKHRVVEATDVDVPCTLLYLGIGSVDSADVRRETAIIMNRFVRGGGRLVMTFLPRNWTRPEEEDEGDEGKEGEGENDENEDEDEDEEQESEEEKEYKRLVVTLSEWWGVSLDDYPVDALSRASLHSGSQTGSLPQSISCHTSLFFDELGEEWRTVYQRGNKPVIVERQIGKGTLVLATPTFFVSNEAVRDERHPELLAWMLGPYRTVVFDEYRHGIAESIGLAGLARRYRLHGAGAGLLLLALFFVWRSASALVPAGDDAEGDTSAMVGRTSVSGLVHLLRRNIPAGRLLSAGLVEWQKSQGKTTRDLEGRLEEMGSIADAEAASPVGTRDLCKAYDKMSRIADPRRKTTNTRKETEKHT